jgi:hypothetical protein
MSQIGQPVKEWEITPLEEPVGVPLETPQREVEEPTYEPAYRER